MNSTVIIILLIIFIIITCIAGGFSTDAAANLTVNDNDDKTAKNSLVASSVIIWISVVVIMIIGVWYFVKKFKRGDSPIIMKILLAVVVGVLFLSGILAASAAVKIRQSSNSAINQRSWLDAATTASMAITLSVLLVAWLAYEYFRTSTPVMEIKDE